ncbi:MAG: UDP-N-acetylmuramate dehydrogenase [Chitinispirillaceae bacterium]|nr:UDP-N-acetylmuramate dehydrogenase [Chitinispirillaceae bacterium]
MKYKLIQENISLKDKNTYNIGGIAKFYSSPKDTEELKRVLMWSRENRIKTFILGRGSNVLVSDNGWDGIVIHLVNFIQPIEFDKKEYSVKVSSGMLLNTFVTEVIKMGYGGIENLAGIPGSIGGAIVMNAGAYSSSISDTLYNVTCCKITTGEIIRYSASELELSYRSSLLQKKEEIVLTADFLFEKRESPEKLLSIRNKILEERKKKQPLEYPSCGSVFKRPQGYFAGELIEKCGLKGMSYGGARISEKHANFIVNMGNATADDVRHLICLSQKRVYEKFGIILEPEVIFVGNFTEPLFTPETDK